MRRHNPSKGQGLTEFALILPILLLLLLGIIEGARIIWAYITVQNAAREAARYAVTGQPHDEAGNPWNLVQYPSDRKPGCDPQFDAGGNLIYTPDLLNGGDCAGPNDRVDAIIGVALQRGRELGAARYAISPAVYDAPGYSDTSGTYGVLVSGAEITGTQAISMASRVDYAGKEGLNVWVQVYYNVAMLDPLYAAIIPSGYVHLSGEVQMQNEGIDTQLGSRPPASISTPTPRPAGTYEPGQENPPVVLSREGSSVEAGSDLDIALAYHPTEQLYDVYLYSSSGTYVAICSNVEVNNFGSGEATCPIPSTTVPGIYQLVSVQAGDTADPANHVGEGDQIEVLYSEQPRLTILDGNSWPPGTTITFQLIGHQPCPAGKFPCPPNQEYDLALIGGAFPSPGLVFATVMVDNFGSATRSWDIPSNLLPGDYTVTTYMRNTTEPVASTSLRIVPAEIVIQGGNRWPAGATIRLHLRGHAPSRSYTLRWTDGRTGDTIDFGPVTTDRFGNTEAAVRFPIPADTQDSPPNHRIISFETGGSGATVASEEVQVVTPQTPFIIVVGGDTWPAGSLIQIELRKHFNGPYNLYFDDILIETIDDSQIGNGAYETTWVIPINMPDGDYEIRTERISDGVTEATTTITVERVPLIRLAEGDTVAPRSEITIQLLNHPPDDTFRILLDGNILFGIPTNGVGSGERVYDLSELPSLRGGPFILESRLDGRRIASTEIFIVAPDLQVTNVRFPAGPPINVEIPVTVTLVNDSPAPISNEYFDVDLYVNPVHAPTPSSQFPPGDYKRWRHTVPASGTIRVVFTTTLRGTQHDIYARADTSNYIIETDENNNIYHARLTSDDCSSEVTNAFSSAANWGERAYGDAGAGSFSLSNGGLTVTSDGSDNWGSSDNMYLAFYNPQTIRGDFEVRVRMTDGPGDDSGENQWANAGLEIRGSVASASSAKVTLGVADSEHTSPSWRPAVQASYRDGSGSASRPPGAPNDIRVSYPLWLRIVRNGDRFDYYYSDSDASTPPASNAWTQHGSVTMANIGPAVSVGFFSASYDGGNRTTTSRFERLRLCFKDAGSPPPGEDFPPGLTVCSGNLVQNAGFEGASLAPWSVPNGAVNKNRDQYRGQFSAFMYTYNGAQHQQPALVQTFAMPDWIVSSTTTIDLSLYTCVRDYTGSRAEPNDQLNAALRTTGASPTLVSNPTLVAGGDTTNSGPCQPNDYVPYSTDLADAIVAAGGNPEDQAGRSLQLFLYDYSSDPGVCNEGNGGGPGNGACYETDYYLDEVKLEVCTTQPSPPYEAGKVYKVGGPLRVFIGGAPQPKQGVRVWTYRRNGELLTTYSLHDSNYFFYNLEPDEEYVFYAEYWDGPNLYSAFQTLRVRSGDAHGNPPVIDTVSLLLR